MPAIVGWSRMANLFSKTVIHGRDMPRCTHFREGVSKRIHVIVKAESNSVQMTEEHRANHYCFHGMGIKVSCNDVAVADAIHSRFRHFASDEPTTSDLSFEYFSVSNGNDHWVEKPPGRARTVHESLLGEVLYFEARDELYISHQENINVLCHPAEGRVQVSVLGPVSDSIWLLSHPMFTLPFFELMKRKGRYGLHAASLSANGKGLLFTGDSGSGKTTLTINLLRAGFDYLGDDMVFLSSGDNGLRMLAFPDEIDVTDETALLFPELEHLVQLPKKPGWHKQQVWVEDIYHVDFVPECRPAVLIFPRITQTEKSVLRPLSRDEALLGLVSNLLMTEISSSQAHFDNLAQLVGETECLRLETGRDLGAIPSLLRQLVM
jgi:hypothetical protein